ncbi:MAG: SH3 domain-containing protein [Terrisporobacter sp.]|uniref:C40 family peptidase n=1 Tax=Terrisporobacter sp. TaxID=1965305 RepID=UPI002FC71BC8
MSINKKYVMAGVLATSVLMPMADTTDSYANETRTTTANVNFRTGPGTNNSSMMVISKGQKVTYLSKSGDWAKVQYNSKTGYVHEDYITSGGNTSTSTSTKYVNASAGLNVRKGPSTSYAKVAKLAHKTKVTVVSTSGGWSKITSGSVTGYVSDSYLSKTNPSTSNDNNTSDDNNQTSTTTKYVKASVGLVVRKGAGTSYAKVTTLANGTKVTVHSTSNGWSKITSGSVTGYVSSTYLTSTKPSTSNDNTSSDSNTDKASKVISYAKKFLGKPYVWGAQGPNSFDCSGFTYYVYKNSVGINLPRTSSTQSGYGKSVSKSNLRAGDLVFFDTVGSNNGGVTHCGIYMGNGQIIHAASGQGKVVINDFNSSYYQKAYVNARRVL